MNETTSALTPSVSVVIPAFNYGRYLRETVESVFRQTYPVDEIIIVDDGSTDDTAQVVQRFGSRVKYLWQLNSGLSAARNAGIRNARGTFVALLDADDVWYTHKLEHQMSLFERDNELGMVFCFAREFDSITGDTMHFWTSAKRNRVALDLLKFEEPTVVAIGSTGVFRKSVFENVGYFDTNLRHSEDWDFSYRLARHYSVDFVPEVLVDYRNHKRNMHKNIRVMEESMKACFAKAFSDADTPTAALRRRAYGNLYSTLAGSYFHNSEFSSFLRCCLTSLIYSPVKASHFLRYPVRVLNRKLNTFRK